MKVLRTDLPEVVVVEPQVFEDDRGWFMESFNMHRFAQALADLGLPAPGSFVQDNQSRSRRGVLRGLHYQLQPHAQGKLVRVLAGEIFDVAVDIRRDSPRFGHWAGVPLSADNRRQMWVPPGFAHGFVSLAEGSEVLYKTTDVYARDCERSIAWNDPRIGIAWPLQGLDLTVSAKDADAPALGAAEVF